MGFEQPGRDFDQTARIRHRRWIANSHSRSGGGSPPVLHLTYKLKHVMERGRLGPVLRRNVTSAIDALRLALQAVHPIEQRACSHTAAVRLRSWPQCTAKRCTWRLSMHPAKRSTLNMEVAAPLHVEPFRSRTRERLAKTDSPLRPKTHVFGYAVRTALVSMGPGAARSHVRSPVVFKLRIEAGERTVT